MADAPTLPGSLRVALAHDWLTGMRGGERVLEVFCELFPHADLFTLVHVQGSMSAPIARMRILPSFLQKLPGAARRYRWFLPLFPLAIGRFRPRGYDLMLTSSSAAAKGIRTESGTLHVCYIHAPMRYMREGFQDYFGPGRARWPVRLAALLARPFLRAWDARNSGRVHRFLANGVNVRGQILRAYGRDGTIIHPPVDVNHFRPGGGEREGFYLMVGAFAPNKRVDQAILAFNRLGLPLTIVGTGQEEARCRAMAGPTIRFLGRLDDSAIADLYRRARAFIFPGVDDFGITPVEAQACGTPVIAFAAGGALETVTPETGILYRDPSPEGLMEAVRNLEANPGRFDPRACVANAQRFSRERFREEIVAALAETLAVFRQGGERAVRGRWG